jgi:hypothetical protein
MVGGADEGIRTPDLRITNALLYQLSYISKTPYKDSNFGHKSQDEMTWFFVGTKPKTPCPASKFVIISEEKSTSRDFLHLFYD